VATAALFLTVLTHSLLPDSWQKQVISWPHAAQQAKPMHGQVIPQPQVHAMQPPVQRHSPVKCKDMYKMRTRAGTLAMPVRTNAIPKVKHGRAAGASCSTSPLH